MADKKNNATCSICGKGYYLCQSCKDYMNLSPWKIHTDTSEHYKIFMIVRGYSIGLYNKSEAKDKLEKVDLSDLENFLPDVKSIINKILTEEKAAVKLENKDKVTDNKKRVKKSADTEDNSILSD